ncbi:MAG: LemA family protein [Candidatus Sulfotelmatobacter sp.]
MKKIALIIVGVIVLAVLWFGSTYVSRRNAMVTKKEAVSAAWSQVDIVLQRRADLIPNLVETVKGFAAQEQTVFRDIANARAALMGGGSPQQKIAANNQLDSALSRLLVVVENYPQLRSNENFLRLQDELAGTENRIAVERKRYNDTLQDYNTYIQTFPNSLIAGMRGFTRNDAYFQAQAGSREAPRVQFPSANPTNQTPTPQPAPTRP